MNWVSSGFWTRSSAMFGIRSKILEIAWWSQRNKSNVSSANFSDYQQWPCSQALRKDLKLKCIKITYRPAHFESFTMQSIMRLLKLFWTRQLNMLIIARRLSSLPVVSIRWNPVWKPVWPPSEMIRQTAQGHLRMTIRSYLSKSLPLQTTTNPFHALLHLEASISVAARTKRFAKSSKQDR